MSSTFLNQIGLGEFDLGYLLIGMGAVILLLIIFLILLIVQIRKTSKLKKRLDKFLSGKDGASLEKDIAGLYEDNKFLKANTEKNKKDIRTLYKNMESAYQKMGLVKYDAFNQMGGQLSFSLALLDENNNGFITNDNRNFLQTCQLGCTPSSLTGNNLIIILTILYQNRLQQTKLFDRIRQFL